RTRHVLGPPRRRPAFQPRPVFRAPRMGVGETKPFRDLEWRPDERRNETLGVGRVRRYAYAGGATTVVQKGALPDPGPDPVHHQWQPRGPDQAGYIHRRSGRAGRVSGYPRPTLS